MAGISNMLGLIMIMAIFASAIATDYCKLKACTDRGVTHTMCLYPKTQPSTSCNEVKVVGLTQAEKDAIVRKHNELRQKVASGRELRGKNNSGPQPPAVSMPNLSWDNELATIAQRWVNQCNFGHDRCRNVERYSVGQNAAISWTTGVDRSKVEDMVQRWYDEVALFDKKHVSKYVFEKETGHYTQVVWAGTTTIGCGGIRYKDSKGWNTNYLVCNYGPSGNWIGAKIYEIKK